MLPINLKDLAPADLQELIDSEVTESLTLEYKQALPSGQSEEKKEFLCDLAAMANTVGGDILYGMVDRRGTDNQPTGIAGSVCGINAPNLQGEMTRLSNLIRDGISPRVNGIQMQSITCPDGDVLVIRVPRSWNKPHMVTTGGINRFCARGASGKYSMSVEEIGRTFSEQGELRQTIQRWRQRRVELALLNEGPAQLAGEVSMLFHAIPTSAFTRDVLRETWKVPDQEKFRTYVPHRVTNYHYNADGFLASARIGNIPEAYGYTQLFRSGIIEYADSQCFGPPTQNIQPMIFGQNLETRMIECYADVLGRFRQSERGDELYIGFSLIGISNKLIFSTLMRLGGDQHRIRDNTFTSPEVLVDINDPEQSPYPSTLLPLVDTMWQVAGLEGTPFKPNGVWDPFKRYM